MAAADTEIDDLQSGPEQFIKTGNMLNYRMQYRQSVMCFTSALQLIREKYQSTKKISSQNLKQFERDIQSYCTGLACAVQTFLHLGNQEKARDILCTYNFKFCESLPVEGDFINLTLGTLFLDVGKEYVQNQHIAVGNDILEEAREHLFWISSNLDADYKKAEVLTVLGYGLLCLGNLNVAETRSLEAVSLWRKLTYPLFAVDMVVTSMKTYIECRLRGTSPNIDEHNVCTDMLRLHNDLYGKGVNCEIPEAFTYLGTVALKTEKEKSSLAFFEEALNLYKKMPADENHKETISKLLRDIGVASYNCRDFQKAANSYKECLEMIKLNNPLNNVNLGQIAECCATLGFTYSRLRNFDKMLEYYEKALDLRTHLSEDDLELIETNIGNLYHVKATLHEKDGDKSNAEKYFTMAEVFFTKALNYSWKSFPYINYGYYLLCRRNYIEAIMYLQQGYLHGIVDKDTIEFDHTEDPILLHDLQRELDGCEDIRIPAVILSLYLKTLAHLGLGDKPNAKYAASQLKQEVQVCKFESYYTEGFGLERMQALCHSLLGYSYRDLEMKCQAKEQFQHAIDLMPDSHSAARNLELLKNSG